MNDFLLGNRICELRVHSGMSQSELADKLGVTAKAVSKWETGAAKPKTQTLRKLAAVFEISVDEMLKLKETGRKTAIKKS